MTGDPVFAARVRRLTIISLVALGSIWWLATATLDAGPAVNLLLFAGWLAMPTVLAASLRRPQARLLVALPATAVSIALLAVCLTALPADAPERPGWLLLTAGILIGGSLGGWFWYRWVPVPEALDDPYSRGRWSLIGIHVGLVVAGLALLILGEIF